jgi:hypothetical protein
VYFGRYDRFSQRTRIAKELMEMSLSAFGFIKRSGLINSDRKANKLKVWPAPPQQ